MDRILFPGLLSGTVTAPCSKSLAHRLLLAAGLAEGTSVLQGVQLSQDLLATCSCLTALGAAWTVCGKTVTIQGRRAASFAGRDLPRLDCGQSGTTLRLLLPVALGLTGGGIFVMQGRLSQRPLRPYQDLFSAHGVQWRQEHDTLTVRGRLEPGDYALPGDVSSQFFSGLLFGLALVPGMSHIVSTTPLESSAYVNLTLSVLHRAGIAAGQEAPGRFWVQGGAFCPLQETVEPDWSQAAVWLAAQALGSPLTAAGLIPDSIQGDRVFADLQARLSNPGTCTIDLSGCPDLFPPLAILAAWRNGETRFTGAGRLRFKESDRLSAMKALLTSLEVRCREEPAGLTVWGGSGFSGGRVEGRGDHRIVMAAAIAGTVARGPVTVTDSECVEKSYPAFWAEFERLGGNSHVL